MTDRQQLRDRIAQAIASVAITIGPNSVALLKDGHTLGLTGGEIDAMALSALAVVQPELDRFREVEAVHQELTSSVHPLVSCSHGQITVPVAALARQIAEKRTALHQRAEACREVDRLRTELAMTRTVPDGDDLPLLCPDCVCADCGGRYAEHEPDRLCGCSCDPACDRFLLDPQLDQIATAIEPILDSPLAEAVAHTAWHAIHPSV